MAVKTPKVTLPRTIVGTAKVQLPTTGVEVGTNIPVDNVPDHNFDINAVRQIRGTTAQLRLLAETDGVTSTSMVSMVRIAMSGYALKAYATGTQQFSQPGLLAAENVISSWDTLFDYTQGYADKRALDALLEQGLFEVVQTGGLGAELVLNKNRIPDRLALFPYDTIIWKGNGKDGRYPSQRAQNPAPGEPAEVDLNQANIWVAEAMKRVDKVYNVSFLGSGLRRLYQYEDYIQDMWRVVKRAGGPRLLIKLDYEKVVASATQDIQDDSEKLAVYLTKVRTDIETQITALAPEDALVFYDLSEVDSVTTEGEKKDYRDLLDALSGLVASGMKSNPSILGLRIGGSQNVASTESMLFAKIARILQGPVEQVMSRALTLAIRLYGIDAYVKFEFKPIDLRPEQELEPYKTMHDNRVYERLSYGFIDDEEAAVELGTGSRPAGMPKLAGTFFYTPKAVQIPSSKDDNLGRQIAGDTPGAAGGADQKDRAV